MASFRRQKEALRAAVFAFIAGAHSVAEEVEKGQSISVLGTKPEATEVRHAMLLADYSRLLAAPQSMELFADILGEEELYPFGSEWPREALIELISKVIPPRLSFEAEAGGEPDYKFRFRKGYKKALTELAASLESFAQNSSTLDHWLTLLINTAFHAGATLAARNAENSKAYYVAVQELEEEVEPWGRYPQLMRVLERQLQRETRGRTGLVTDLD